MAASQPMARISWVYPVLSVAFHIGNGIYSGKFQGPSRRFFLRMLHLLHESGFANFVEELAESEKGA